MDKFVIDTSEDKIFSINRTIRMKPEHFEKVTEISERTGVSFNKIVVQCMDFALSRFDEDNQNKVDY